MQTQITVRESLAGKFGPQLKDNAGYLSFGKFYKGPTEFAPGTVLNVELYVTEKGSRYINKAELSEGTPNFPVAEAPKRGRKPSVRSAEETVNALPVKKEVNWDELGRGKTASLFVAALLQNPNVVQQLDGVDVDQMDTLIWELVDLVFKTRKDKV